ncbi:MAG TPA: GNAT family N-acetyltransferase [Solirubrobacteraceae bacterium]|nr:GNAT family N-acetyltransferase [Solirubrobacteraceae bacterium]
MTATGDGEPVRLTDGSTLVVRPIEPGDRDLLRSGFEQLSEHSRYMRFQAPLASLSDQQLEYLTEVDHHDHEALLALAPEGIVGVARFVRVNHAVAECAVAVADHWQERGVGTALLDRLVERARAEGIERFTALVLAENAEALRLLERLGDTEQRRIGSQVELDISLPEPRESSPQMKLVLATAARGLLIPAISMWRQVADFAHARRRRAAPTEPANVIVAHAHSADGTAPAIRLAADLAAARDAHLHLVESYWPVVSDRAEIDRRLTVSADDLREQGLNVTTHVIGGDTVDAVIDVAERSDAALIVIDPRAASAVTPWRAYSLPARVCARAPCDVLLAR